MRVPGAILFQRLKPEGFPVLAAMTAVLVLATAHALETTADMVPCPLCLDQREALWWGVGASVAAVVAHRYRDRIGLLPFRALVAGAGAAFLWSTWLAGFHIGVENGWWASACSGVPATSPSEMLASGDASRPIARCDEAARLFGISLAAYNLCLSLGLTLFVTAPLWRARALAALDRRRARETHP